MATGDQMLGDGRGLGDIFQAAGGQLQAVEVAAQAHVVGTPGSGFGASGEGYIRISAFNSRENVEEAIARIRRVFSA